MASPWFTVDFESPYVPGPLVGQQGWSASTGDGAEFVVRTAGAIAGAQSLFVDAPVASSNDIVVKSVPAHDDYSYDIYMQILTVITGQQVQFAMRGSSQMRWLLTVQSDGHIYFKAALAHLADLGIHDMSSAPVTLTVVVVPSGAWTVKRNGTPIGSGPGYTSTGLPGDLLDIRNYSPACAGFTSVVVIDDLVGQYNVSASVPTAPLSLQADISPNSIDLSWQPPTDDGFGNSDGSGLTHYKVYRATSSGALGTKTLIKVVPKTTLSYSDTNIEFGQEYFYQVTAENNAGEGPGSNEASAEIEIDVSRFVPQNLYAVPRLNFTAVNWDKLDVSIDTLTYLGVAIGKMVMNTANGTVLAIPKGIAPGNHQRLLLASTHQNITSGLLSIHRVQSMTFNGKNLIFLGEIVGNQSTTYTIIELWYLPDPDEGTHDLIVTLPSQGANETPIIVGAHDLKGVDRSTPFGTVVSANGTNDTATIDVTATISDLVFAACAGRGDFDMTPAAAGMTIRYNEFQDSVLGAGDPGWQIKGAAATKLGAAGLVNMKWTDVGGPGNDDWGIIGMAMKQATGI
jgi:hypothetical protein